MFYCPDLGLSSCSTVPNFARPRVLLFRTLPVLVFYCTDIDPYSSFDSDPDVVALACSRLEVRMYKASILNDGDEYTEPKKNKKYNPDVSKIV